MGPTLPLNGKNFTCATRKKMQILHLLPAHTCALFSRVDLLQAYIGPYITWKVTCYLMQDYNMHVGIHTRRYVHFCHLHVRFKCHRSRLPEIQFYRSRYQNKAQNIIFLLRYKSLLRSLRGIFYQNSIFCSAQP